MENATNTKSAVDLTLETQRRESEAKAILQDLERLKIIPVERKRRWVWELLQNARDCAPRDCPEEFQKVNVAFTISENKLTFTHDGNPFSLGDLLALVCRTSTKDYDTEDGNTGKFGTGFVTTHVLNRKVKVSGLLKKEFGYRDFTICINRTTDILETLQSELNNVFVEINNFYEQDPVIHEKLPLTKYEYELEPEILRLVVESIEELKRNLPFTLLVNDRIKSVKITDERIHSSNIYSISESKEVKPGVIFSRLTNGIEDIDQQENGLFHYSNENLTIAVPVFKQNGTWHIDQIESQARIYREFPLVGTEHWHIPFFVQSSDFLPAEPRDGIRTIKDNELKDDKTADDNRKALIKYRDSAIEFFKNLHAGSYDRLFLLTESGLPKEKTEYTSVDWYTNSIQHPLRTFFLSFPLVKTAAGDFIKINQAKFPQQFSDQETNDLFYSIAAKFYYTQFPEESNYVHWQRIISQDTSYWGDNLICSPENLVQEINNPEGLTRLHLPDNESQVNWLDSLISFLHKINRTDLCDNSSIYPNQEGILKMKHELRVDPGLNEKIKSIGNRLNQPIYRQLLNNDITQRDGIDLFDTKGFFDVLNTFIGNLIPSTNTAKEFEAIFELVCMFNDSYARERDKWFQLVQQLLPGMAPEKVVVSDMGEFNYDSAELASIKYVCWLIDQQSNFQSFSNTYFQQNNASAYEWLNNFIDILYRNQKYEVLISKHAVIPMQNGTFRKLENGIFREDKKDLFEPLFKELYTTYSANGDARGFLVALEITNENLPWKTQEVLTKPIDDLFIATDIEKKVEPDGVLNPLFHKLNEWIGKNELSSDLLFPHFCRQRPMLYIKAFGPEVSKMIVALHKMKKPIEELQALANLNMSAAELGLLVKASQMAGGIDVLMSIAAELEKEAQEAQWRNDVGKAAEDAFKEAILDISAFNIENPDIGYDFEITTSTNNDKFFLEIKSTVQFKENIQMSSTQGRVAKDNPGKYALCVVSRQEANDVVTKEYFIEHAKFLTTVGILVHDKVVGIENGLNSIRTYKIGEEVSSALENEKYSVFVGKKSWNTGISFPEFVIHLKKYFNLQ